MILAAVRGLQRLPVEKNGGGGPGAFGSERGDGGADSLVGPCLPLGPPSRATPRVGHGGPWVGALPLWTQEWLPLFRTQDLLDGLLESLRKEGPKLLEQRQAEEQSRQECQVGLLGRGQEAAGKSPPSL